MRILHTSDWHLGKRLDDFSRLDEQRQVLEEIAIIADEQQVDAVVVAGDLFDTYNPPIEAIELFYKALKKLTRGGTRPIVAIAGNHDSPDRIESPDPLARECGIIFAGYPNTKVAPFELEGGFKVTQTEEGFVELKLESSEHLLRIIHTAYANEFRMKAYFGSEDTEEELRDVLAKRWSKQVKELCATSSCNMLVSHLFFIKEGVEVEEEADDEKPIVHVGGAQAIYTKNIPEGVQYVALGHLHRMHEVDSTPCPIVYSGSPLAYSFAESNQQKYVVVVELEPGKPAAYSAIPLTKGRKLLRHRAEGVAQAAEWLRANTDSLVEVTIVSETYLTAQERRMLNEVHPAIVAVIPEVKSAALALEERATADLTRSTDEIFKQYFTKEKGQEPSESLMALFKEVLAEEGDQ
jgi:exonuclease SbcD